MEIIAKVSKSIIDEIDLYYKWQTPELQEYGDLLMAIPELKHSKLVVDADTLLMLTLYVLMQSEMTVVEMHSQVNLIYEFTTESQKHSKSGYSVTCLEVCLESILDQEPEFDNDQVNLSKVEEDDNSSIDFSNYKEPRTIEELYAEK